MQNPKKFYKLDITNKQQREDKMYKQKIIINDDTTAQVDRDTVKVGEVVTVTILDENSSKVEVTGTVTDILD